MTISKTLHLSLAKADIHIPVDTEPDMLGRVIEAAERQRTETKRRVRLGLPIGNVRLSEWERVTLQRGPNKGKTAWKKGNRYFHGEKPPEGRGGKQEAGTKSEKKQTNTTDDRKRWESVFGTLNEQPIDTPLNGYESGLQLIQKFDGQQVSKRKTTMGTDLVTYRVDFPGTSYLLTWGHPGPIMTRGEGRKVRLPMKWQMVSFANDFKDNKSKLAPKPKADKVTPQAMVEKHKAIMAKGSTSHDDMQGFVDDLLSMTVKDINEVKKSLGLKASGKKAELAKKIGQKAFELVGKGKAAEVKTEPEQAKPEPKPANKPANKPTEKNIDTMSPGELYKYAKELGIQPGKSKPQNMKLIKDHLEKSNDKLAQLDNQSKLEEWKKRNKGRKLERQAERDKQYREEQDKKDKAAAEAKKAKEMEERKKAREQKPDFGATGDEGVSEQDGAFGGLLAAISMMAGGL